jgi:uncharacterized HAD superfamily protein
MNFSKCECANAGFCSLYNKTMTSNPPNWQWCQNATPEEREKYKERSDLGIEKIKRRNKPGSIITIEDMLNVTRTKLMPKIKNLPISGIVGVPRSGMIPASVMSVELSLPLYSLQGSELKLLSAFSEYGGLRMGFFKPASGKLLFLDDTANSGYACNQVRQLFPNCLFATVYSTTLASNIIDYYGEILEPPHVLDWNFFNSAHATNSLFDIDGVFCENPPWEVCQDEQSYINYITNVEPHYKRIPKLFYAKALVTGRLEKYRSITEEWLKKHKFNYKKLIMFPTEREQERNNNHYFVVGKYKADVASQDKAIFFVESEMSEAKVIKEYCPKLYVACPNDYVYL